MHSIRPVMLAPVTLAFALLGGSAHAAVLNLMAPVGGANLYAIHDFTAPSSDVEGAVVAGGNVTISSYSINHNNKDAFGTDGYALVAGGNLALQGGSIENGKAYVGGTSALTWAATPDMSTNNPVDFKATSNYYKGVADALSDLDPTGSVTRLWSGVKVTGNGSGGVDVFDVSSDLFANSSSWTLEQLVPGQTLVFNVSGGAGTFNNGGISFEPLAGYNVLFNFYEATSIDVRGVIGSVLAPYATQTANWGVINGNVIVDTWSSTVQVNSNHYFNAVDIAGLKTGPNDNDTPAHVPEPGSVALVLAGLAAAGMARRKRRQA
ncbi:choice-of-anchor A family protein [Massilia sp. Root335]|uniref:choice-of-anchor A family protein n=1 Tax=Massilia sp. Root335 TaxID=1736517 RepID=UPI0009E91594|nr:choice-of-anchor A family protein [Massilia sp. Root335]